MVFLKELMSGRKNCSDYSFPKKLLIGSSTHYFRLKVVRYSNHEDSKTNPEKPAHLLCFPEKSWSNY